MPVRLRFHLATVLHLAETATTAHRRVDIDGTVVTHAPPALHLMRDHGDGLDDHLYIDGNFHPSLSADNINTAPFRSTYQGRRYGHGITWTEWLGHPPRHRNPVQAVIPLADGRLLDLIRAGHAAGFDLFTVDIDVNGGMRPSVARRRVRPPRACRTPQAGAPEPAGPA
ncbi:hypothetical protein [Micromonospora yangpuensis]|uniref:Uncharacterized protein n=1 Tax=Micromonospora yangpuensis TaxID=683228 RepID=A0A1C6U3V4_9ACTN|nr:hypothetical protein [Micromonospora yangpuensis]GGL93049.1 hypothetical protein GCM10012279_08480 [Micromonospora yangpuensis]SCL48755.1 hypothetical protein GA0070617_0969 [Micromonospora yangpuensis]